MAKKCVVCDEWFNEKDLIAIFTGRMKYMCFRCYVNANMKLNERNYSKKVRKHDK